MTAIVGALISSLGFGSANIVIKKSLSGLTILQTLTMSSISGVFFVFLFTLFTNSFESVTTSLLLTSLVFSVGELLLYFSVYKAFQIGNVTVSNALISTYPLITTLYAVFILSEQITLSKFFFIIIIIIGSILVSIDWREVKKDGFHIKDFMPGLPVIIFAMMIHGFYFPLLGEFTDAGNWQFRLLMIKVFSSLLLFIGFFLIARKKILPPKNKIAFTSLLGLLEMIGWAGFSWAISNTSGQTAIIVTLLNMASIITAIFAYIFLKERISKPQYLGILIVVVGVTALSL